ncbi:hypothetical protein [Corallococcus carmarthensis]|uniref:Endonuclease/exonuclease/phosphatase domain-containing protein n=1 Tax=Corallococcus carmarthensis TaxID=2316728 RepID=A0A3A8KI77_9BACT|nr:hypothetical protein [Corallococcus carmarthensis]RKH07660.1 hypothetical protein D7X32_00885 [Corallococcus carmarthensis]
MPKREFDEGIDTATLPRVSILFIPFDAAKKFYKANTTKGVKGLSATFDDTGKRVDGANLANPLVPSLASSAFLQGPDIASKLADIVQQECDLIRNMHNPDSDYDDNYQSWLKSNGPQAADTSQWSDRRKNRIERNLRGYKHYPVFVFLSENPTGSPFPDRIDPSGLGMSYVRRHLIDDATVKGIKHVNEIALYLREDIHEQVENPKNDGFYLEATTLTRKTASIQTKLKSKDEYILKVTLGNRYGHSVTVAGVHLRASLTGSNPHERQVERNALQTFCVSEGIQVMVGDFNMDLQETTQGSRGVFFDGRPETQPTYMLAHKCTEAIPLFHQQYSNSAGNAHYMGYYQADTEHLELSGPGMYGLMGASGSRHLKSEGKYYSDHPSIYLQVKSTRLSDDARNKIIARKILRVVRPMK